MLRLAPREHYRFEQVAPGEMDLTFGGAESNVAVSIAMFGAAARFLTALPNHAIADAFMR